MGGNPCALWWHLRKTIQLNTNQCRALVFRSLIILPVFLINFTANSFAIQVGAEFSGSVGYDDLIVSGSRSGTIYSELAQKFGGEISLSFARWFTPVFRYEAEMQSFLLIPGATLTQESSLLHRGAGYLRFTPFSPLQLDIGGGFRQFQTIESLSSTAISLINVDSIRLETKLRYKLPLNFILRGEFAYGLSSSNVSAQSGALEWEGSLGWQWKRFEIGLTYSNSQQTIGSEIDQRTFMGGYLRVSFGGGGGSASERRAASQRSGAAPRLR